ELGMLFEIERVGPVGKFKEVEVDEDNESEEESDTEGDYTIDSDSEDLDYNPKHDDVFDDEEHIVEEVHVNMNNFRFTVDPKHDTSIGGVDVQDDDLDVIDNWQLVDGRDQPIITCLEYIREYLMKRNVVVQKVIAKTVGPLTPSVTKIFDAIKKAHFSGRAKCDLLINNICEVFNRQLVDGRDQPIITCLEYIREYLMKRIMVVQKVIAKTVGPLTLSVTKIKWELTGIPCKHVVAAIYNMSKNSVGVGIPKQWVHAAYKLETWAHVYSFKVNPCNGRDMWPIVDSRTVIIPPLYKPPISRPPKKRKKSNDEIASQSASSGKLSRKGKSVSYGKCGNVGHNRKGCRGQGGGSSQAGARKVSGQAAGATNVSGQAAGARKVFGQAVGATNVSGQAAGARKVSGQVADARKASSQPSAAQSTAKQGPRQGFQGPIAGPASGSQRKTKKLVDI
ncbi:hypothetical protein Tco_1205599, partial [Tanacetum coccineum]